MTERESWETGLSERERRRFESDGAERRAERERATEQTRQIERLGDGAERRVNALFPVLFSLPFLFTVPCFVRNSKLCIAIVVCFFLFAVVVFCRLCNLLFWVFFSRGFCPYLECGIQSFLDVSTLCLGYKVLATRYSLKHLFPSSI
jgi:hypothetical protein